MINLSVVCTKRQQQPTVTIVPFFWCVTAIAITISESLTLSQRHDNGNNCGYPFNSTSIKMPNKWRESDNGNIRYRYRYHMLFSRYLPLPYVATYVSAVLFDSCISRIAWQWRNSDVTIFLETGYRKFILLVIPNTRIFMIRLRFVVFQLSSMTLVFVALETH